MSTCGKERKQIDDFFPLSSKFNETTRDEWFIKRSIMDMSFYSITSSPTYLLTFMSTSSHLLSSEVCLNDTLGLADHHLNFQLNSAPIIFFKRFVFKKKNLEIDTIIGQPNLMDTAWWDATSFKWKMRIFPQAVFSLLSLDCSMKLGIAYNS